MSATFLFYLMIGTPILLVVMLFIALMASAVMAPTLSESPNRDE